LGPDDERGEGFLRLDAVGARISVEQGSGGHCADGGTPSTSFGSEGLGRLKVESRHTLSGEREFLAWLVAKDPWPYLIGKHRQQANAALSGQGEQREPWPAGASRYAAPRTISPPVSFLLADPLSNGLQSLPGLPQSSGIWNLHAMHEVVPDPAEEFDLPPCLLVENTRGIQNAEHRD